MKNTYNRISYFSSVLFNATLILLLAIFMVSYIKPQPSIKAAPKITLFGNARTNSYMRFVPAIDLSSQFDFNTKQIFMYVICNTEDRSEMVWSKLIQKGDDYRLFETESNNYVFSTGGSDKPVFEIRGNIYPYVGKMKDVSYGFFKQ